MVKSRGFGDIEQSDLGWVQPRTFGEADFGDSRYDKGAHVDGASGASGLIWISLQRLKAVFGAD